jgi:hypothetical protein
LYFTIHKGFILRNFSQRSFSRLIWNSVYRTGSLYRHVYFPLFTACKSAKNRPCGQSRNLACYPNVRLNCEMEIFLLNGKSDKWDFFSARRRFIIPDASINHHFKTFQNKINESESVSIWVPDVPGGQIGPLGVFFKWQN